MYATCVLRCSGEISYLRKVREQPSHLLVTVVLISLIVYTLCEALYLNRLELIMKIHFRSALLNQGYRVSIFHGQPKAIKTDAPHHVLPTSKYKHCIATK